MLRASLLTTFVLCAGCGSGFDPADRRDTSSPTKNSRPKIILAYEVKRQSGETMRAVAQRFQIPLKVLERFNPRAIPERRPAILYVPVAQVAELKVPRSNKKSAPIVKLMRDPFLRPIKIGLWSALEEEQFQTLDEWFLPDEEQRLSFPVEGYISSGFSWRWNRFHKGLDIATRAGSPIVAAQDGKVIFRGWRSGFGLLVIIQHKQGRTYYAHCQSTKVKRGQSVSRGDLIATVGATGQSRGPHLHFEFRDNNNQPLDPTAFLMPPCSRPVALSAQPGPSLAGTTSWAAKSSPCQSSDL
jgi:murein DD-endopeptidase MepM/ murein hydrolase activator NlpD